MQSETKCIVIVKLLCNKRDTLSNNISLAEERGGENTMRDGVTRSHLPAGGSRAECDTEDKNGPAITIKELGAVMDRLPLERRFGT